MNVTILWGEGVNNSTDWAREAWLTAYWLDKDVTREQIEAAYELHKIRIEEGIKDWTATAEELSKNEIYRNALLWKYGGNTSSLLEKVRAIPTKTKLAIWAMVIGFSAITASILNNEKVEDNLVGSCTMEAVSGEVTRIMDTKYIPTTSVDTGVENTINKTNADGSLNIYFPYNGAGLAPNDIHDIREYFANIVSMWKTPTKVVIEGYADETGSDDINEKYSVNRALNTRDNINEVLHSLGVKNVEIVIQNYGEKMSSGGRNVEDRKVTIRPTC